MPHYNNHDICNLSLVGHSGAGKTTLVDALLHHAGMIPTQGNISQGNTVCDFDPQEKALQHSLNASLVSIDQHGKHINLIDTPGAADFMGHALSTFPAVETIGVVINAQTGIEMMTQRFLQHAGERKLCRMIIINKIDALGVDLPQLIADIRAQFGNECLPINLPANDSKQVVDCFFNPDGNADFSSVAEVHNTIIDQVVEVDEELMNLYLEQGQTLEATQLHDPFEQALREGHLVPICFVSATTGAGIPELFEIIARLLPNPLEGNPRPFLQGEGDAAQPFMAEPDPDKHVVAHVFKVTSDPYVGKLGVFRIHQGTITKDSQLFIGDGRKPFKVAHLFKLQGKQQTEISKGMPGDICAVAKVEDLHFDAVLHDSHDEDYLHLKPLDFPQPMYSLAIEVKRQGDEQKVNSVLHKLADEDPCLVVEHHASLNETVLRGLGELHLRVVLERMAQQFNVEVNTKTPKIAYRETISSTAEGHHRHKKQTGGAGQFGEVFLRIEPLPRDDNFKFDNQIVGGAIPSQFIPAVQKGIDQVMESGAIAGYTMQNIKVTVYDGKYHNVDSKEIAFVTAAKKAFLDAIQKASPLILEPIVALDVSVPDSAVGTVTGDLAGKRARIVGNDVLAGQMVLIRAEAPLAELNNYPTELKSLTGGIGSYTMQLSHYEPVPMNIQKTIVAAYQPHEEE